LYLGFLLCFPSLAAAAVWLIIIAFYWFVARYEEKLLLEKFGPEYEHYMREVPMFLPRIRKGRSTRGGQSRG
jgi:protein-S-isoprenylcysteine O-methyltransferase Ste14